MAATSSSPPCSSSLSLSLSAKKVGQQRFPALRRFLFFFFLSFQPTPGLCRATSVRGKSVCVYCIYNRHTHTWDQKSQQLVRFFWVFFLCKNLDRYRLSQSNQDKTPRQRHSWRFGCLLLQLRAGIFKTKLHKNKQTHIYSS